VSFPHGYFVRLAYPPEFIQVRVPSFRSLAPSTPGESNMGRVPLFFVEALGTRYVVSAARSVLALQRSGSVPLGFPALHSVVDQGIPKGGSSWILACSDGSDGGLTPSIGLRASPYFCGTPVYSFPSSIRTAFGRANHPFPPFFFTPIEPQSDGTAPAPRIVKC